MKKTPTQILNTRSQLEAALADPNTKRGREAFERIFCAGPIVRDVIWKLGKDHGFAAMMRELGFILK